MPDQTEFSRALLLAVDMWRYGARDGWQQAELQQALSDAVSAAAGSAGLDRASWVVQDSGDGFLARIEDSSAEPALVGRFVRELDARLERFNHARHPEKRLRLRLSLHHGGSLPAAHGYASDGPVHVCRLLDAEQARAVLAGLPDANLVQVVSQPIFDGCVRQRLTEVSEAEFTRIRVDLPAKNFSAEAWIRVPGVPAAAVSELAGPGSLVLELRPDSHVGADLLDKVVRASFTAAGIAAPEMVTEDGEALTMSLPARTPGELVLGVWLHHLREALDAFAPEVRIAVGVAFGRAPAAAREVAGGAARFLAGVDDSPVVVAVSGDVHRRFVAGSSARMVMPDSYRPLGTGPESWVRVPGYSVPPKPAPTRTEKAVSPAAPRIGVACGPVSNFEGGTFHGPVVVGAWHDNRGAGR
ncbi:hypothetical protein [Amycolatopsis sp. DG1A-15b]|uniref:hypothetical protein n=1 Tax=Amycolatopsis sp. DG1A-15b TaxID=3052846 RepID=UPI00255B56F1|nr:hypothetical protein [Amycolatopsis sp. DG1A-15b]WIX85525.1 hypothetical protein QRY02_30380 [Amycolatopsis sp. DG1A-15b]